MSKRHWGNGFASGLIVGVCLTALVLVATSVRELSDAPPTSSGEQQQQHNEKPGEGHLWLIPRVVYADDTAAQWAMMVLTVLATYLLLQTLWATQEMATEQSRIGRAQTRAYLSVREGKLLQGSGHGLTFRAVINNSGSSPALKVNAILRLRVGGENGDGLEVWRGRVDGAIGDIPAGGKIKLDCFIPEEVVIPWNAADTDDLILLANGAVFYSDVFEREWEIPYTFMTTRGERLAPGVVEPVGVRHRESRRKN